MSFSFGSTPAAGGAFGAPASSASSFGGFGTPAATSGGFGSAATPAFGASASTPAPSGFGGFGAQSAAKPATLGGFGTAATSGFGSSTPAATSSFGGGFGAAAQTPAAGGFGATTQPTASFGGFGTPAAAPATSGFGGFGSAAKPAATSSFGGFGSPAPAAAPSSSFGGFGTPAPSLGGFGATNAASNTLGGGFGNTGFGNQTQNNGAGAYGYNATVVPVSMAEAVCEFPVETLYKDMPEPYKAEIDRTWKEMKQPMKMKLEEISRSRGVIFDEVHNELRRIHLAVLNVENEQRRLQSEIRPFLADLKRTSETGRLQAAIGLQQIRNQSMGSSLALTNSSEPLRNLLDEDLPCKWYGLVAEQLSSRLSKCIETVHNYERQLATRLHALQGGVLGTAGRGTYGQLRRVGVQELVALMQEQAKVFLQIAAAVAQVHKEADSMRQLYLSIKNDNAKSPRGFASSSSTSSRIVNPFDEADRKEAAEQRVREQRVHTEAARYHQQKLSQYPAGQQSQQTPQAGGFGATGASAGGFGSLGGFGSPAPAAGGFGATTTPSLGAAGGFGIPAAGGASGFGGFGGAAATPVAGAATPSAGGFGGFGATPAATPAATGGFGGFGTPASSLGGKSSFAALDLATPSAAGGFGGFGSVPTPGGPNNPKKGKSKK
eukprot:gene23238-26306_t